MFNAFLINCLRMEENLQSCSTKLHLRSLQGNMLHDVQVRCQRGFSRS